MTIESKMTIRRLAGHVDSKTKQNTRAVVGMKGTLGPVTLTVAYSHTREREKEFYKYFIIMETHLDKCTIKTLVLLCLY